jgi:hypothetical protein
MEEMTNIKITANPKPKNLLGLFFKNEAGGSGRKATRGPLYYVAPNDVADFFGKFVGHTPVETIEYTYRGKVSVGANWTTLKNAQKLAKALGVELEVF